VIKRTYFRYFSSQFLKGKALPVSQGYGATKEFVGKGERSRVSEGPQILI
jgi:hypothetical protein